VKPGRTLCYLIVDSYRPINLLTCGYCLTQYGLRKVRNTRDCLSLLTTDIRQRTIMFSYIKGDQLRLRSIEYKFRNVLFYQFQYQYFHEKKQLCKFYFSPKRVLVLLIENSWKPYIYILCGVMLEKELPLGIVRFLWRLLWCKSLQ
jgi:hypothetical protein